MKITISINRSRKIINVLFILFLSYFNYAYCYAAEYQQEEFNLQGSVVDASSNLPLPGVTILVKGTTTGSITDIDGNFSLNVKSGTILQFSFVGYLKEEITISNQTELSVALVQDIIGLDEVVVTGYGVQKKSDLTGAIASVSGDKLSKTPITGLDQALQGMAAGVNIIPVTGRPGSGVNIQIRGVSSINGTAPIIIIDGVSKGTDQDILARMNPNDVESIEVLKDASSAAIYGASGGNGVIIVTTKKGKSGDMKVNYNGYFGEEQVLKKLDLMNSQQWLEVMDEGSTSKTPITYNPDTLKTYDWQDIMFKKAQTQNHDISISGGNDKSRFMVSSSVTKQNGIMKSTDNQRFTLRLNSDHTINKYITFEQRLSYVNLVTTGFADWEYSGYYQNPVMPSLQMTPYLPAYDENGLWSIPYGGGSNPLVALDMKDNTMKKNNFEGNFSLTITPIKGLSYTTRYTRTLGYDDNREYQAIYYASTTNSRTQNALIQSMKKYMGWNIQNIVSYNKTFFGDHNLSLMAGQEAAKWWSFDLNGQRVDMPSDMDELLYFDFSVNDTLAKQVINGTGDEGRSYRYFGRLNYDYKSKYLLTVNVSRDAHYSFGPQNKIGNFPSFSFGWKFSEEEFMKNLGFINFGKVRFGWGSTGANAKTGYPYLTTVTVPDKYMYATNGRTASVGAGPEQIANPAIMWETIKMTNYGLDLGMFDNKLSITAEYFIKLNDGMIMPQEVPYIVGSYEMTMPEVNIGSIQNKGFEFTLGHKNTFGDFKYSFDFNLSAVRNKILSLATDSLQKGAVHNINPITLTREGGSVSEFFGYQTNGLFSEADPTRTVISGSRSRTYITNQPYKLNASGDTTFMQPFAQAGDVRYVDVNGDGVLNAEDRVTLGSPLPKFTYGFTINLEYKMFDLNASFVGSYGNKVFNGTKQYLYYSQGYGNRLAEFDNRYKDEVVKDGVVVVRANKDSDIPRNVSDNYTRPTSFYIEDGSYFRLRSIQLGITAPKSISSKIGVENLRVYFGAKNLFTITKYKGFDPVVSGGNTTATKDNTTGTMAQGIDIGCYPSTKMFLVGINLEF